MSIEIISILMFGAMILMLATGLPMVFVLGGIGSVFGLLIRGPAALHAIIANMSEMMRATILVACPLFVFMAYMLERSGIAEDLYDVMHRWMGSLRGGLAAGTVMCCTLVAAMSGISSTGVLLMGIIGLPAMLRRRYDKKLAMGAIMAGGALGPLIPPSLILIIYALIAGESVGKLFLGGIIPGLVLSGLFVGYILIKSFFYPNIAPSLPLEERTDLRDRLISLKGLVFPILLVAGVLGSIFFGLATPTEAAAVGAFGSILSAAMNRKLTMEVFRTCSVNTLKTIGMVMWVLYGASCFSSIYQGLGATELVKNILIDLEISKWLILIIMQISWLVLGSLMDSISILMITSPVFIPVATYLDFDLLWFGILFAVNTETGYLTPPFGVNLIVMKGITQDYKGISMSDIYNSVWPFVILQIIGIALLILFPELATWLPELVFN